MRSLLRFLLLRLVNLGGREEGLYTLLVDARQLRALQDLARRERRLPEEIASELLYFALIQRISADQNLRRWHSLSPREQEITALVALGYTNREIAQRLVISPETVKTHITTIARKCNLGNKQELRQAMHGWDFRAWDDDPPE
jgi:DNA-binding NarL/FixJ family response regulator